MRPLRLLLALFAAAALASCSVLETATFSATPDGAVHLTARTHPVTPDK